MDDAFNNAKTISDDSEELGNDTDKSLNKMDTRFNQNFQKNFTKFYTKKGYLSDFANCSRTKIKKDNSPRESKEITKDETLTERINKENIVSMERAID